MKHSLTRKCSRHLLLAAMCILGVSACSQSEQTDLSASNKKPLPEPSSAGAKLLDNYCSECHAPPHPSAHARGDWKSVVERMKDHRTTQGYNTLSADEVIRLTEYLDKYASGPQ